MTGRGPGRPVLNRGFYSMWVNNHVQVSSLTFFVYGQVSLRRGEVIVLGRSWSLMVSIAMATGLRLELLVFGEENRD